MAVYLQHLARKELMGTVLSWWVKKSPVALRVQVLSLQSHRPAITRQSSSKGRC